MMCQGLRRIFPPSMSNLRSNFRLFVSESEPAHRYDAGRPTKTSTMMPTRRLLMPSTSTIAPSWSWAVRRQISMRRANELTKRKVVVETDAEQLEHVVFQISSDVRRRKRIHKSDIQAVVQLLDKGTSIEDHGTFLLTCCSEFLPDVNPMEKVKLGQNIWTAIQKEGKESLESFDALLKCYTDNEFSSYDPLTTLETMKSSLSKAAGREVKPSQTTFYNALLSYCQRGDLANAVKVLNLVKEEELPVGEPFFNALILGNARAGDLSTAKEILNIMKSTHVEPSSRTYSILMQSCIELNNIEELGKTYNTAFKEIKFSEKDILRLASVSVLKGNEAALEKVLEWVPSKTEDVFIVFNSVTSLVHFGFPEQALRIFLKCAEAMQIPGESSGIFLIKELVYSNTDLATIISICDSLSENGYNFYALNSAAEYSLKGKRFDLSFSLFEKMKEKHLPLRAHYFWPILINLFNTDGVKGITHVLQKMQDLEVAPDWETKYEMVVPRLFSIIINPVEVARILKDSGISVSSESLKAILMYLLKQNRLSDASDLLKKLKGTLPQPNGIIDLLLHSLLDFDARDRIEDNLKLVIPILSAISQNTPTDDKTDHVGKFLIRFIEAIGVGMPDLAKTLTEGIENARIPVSEVTLEILQQQTRFSCNMKIDPELSLNEGVQHRTFLHPREMDVRGLESHAEELKAKALNPRGTLRKLFIKYCQAKEFNKALKVKEEFEENHGELSVGMQSALLGLYVQRGQLKLALELYENLKTASTDLETHERWKLDCFKIYDLATLMVESQMVDQAYSLLERDLSLPNVAIPEDLKSVTRNVVRLLEAFHKYDNSGNHYVREALNLILEKEMVAPCSPVLGIIIKHYVSKNETETALELFTSYSEKYKLTPGSQKLAYAVLKNKTLLPKYIAACVAARGEVNTKHSLAYSMADMGDTQGASKMFTDLGSRIQFISILKQCEFLCERREVGKILNLIKTLERCQVKVDTSKLYLIALKSCQRSNNSEDINQVVSALQEQRSFVPSHVFRFADQVRRQCSSATIGRE